MNKSDLNSLDFAVDHFSMKLFKIVTREIVKTVKNFLALSCSVLSSEIDGTNLLVSKYNVSENLLCKIKYAVLR